MIIMSAYIPIHFIKLELKLHAALGTESELRCQETEFNLNTFLKYSTFQDNLICFGEYSKKASCIALMKRINEC